MGLFSKKVVPAQDTKEFAVPLDVNSASVAYVDGVLTITVPKALSTRVVKLQVA